LIIPKPKKNEPNDTECVERKEPSEPHRNKGGNNVQRTTYIETVRLIIVIFIKSLQVLILDEVVPTLIIIICSIYIYQPCKSYITKKGKNIAGKKIRDASSDEKCRFKSSKNIPIGTRKNLFQKY